ncbi:MAG: methyltransferase domain-containing protein [Acidobacteriota bacterium]
MTSRPESTAEPEVVKRCCARLYESDIVRALLGESFHPGGLELTERLGTLLQLTPASRVLDAASGIGTSAMFLAERFGCTVVGIDYSVTNVARARDEAIRRGRAERVSFEAGDVEALPFPDASFDAVLCECAFCTFPDKSAAAREFARVLRPGGRVALSDVTREPSSDADLSDLFAWIACLADARPQEAYADALRAAGFSGVVPESHRQALLDLVHQIEGRLLTVEVLGGLRKIDLSGVNLDAGKRLARAARTAIESDRLGYAIVHAVNA